MKRRSLAILPLLLTPFLLLAQEPSNPISLIPAGFKVVSSQGGDASGVLRGYGKVQVTSQEISGGRGRRKKEYQVRQFEASSPENASTVTGKYLADLNLSPGVTTGTLAAAGKAFPLVTVPGGAVYTGFASGNTGYVISSADSSSLKAFLASCPAASGKIVTAFKYPDYLDRFDRHGWGFYSFRGNWNPSSKPGYTDPEDDMNFVSKYNFRFELTPNPALFDDNFSVPERHEMAWKLEEARKFNVPVSARLYGNLPHVKQFTDAFDRPAPFMEGGWYWSTLGHRQWGRQSWFHPGARLYIARQAQEEVSLYLSSYPEIESWMMPYGEISTYDWYVYHGDHSAAALADWHLTLRDKLRLPLDEVSAMYDRKDKPFASYDEVPIPEVATFDGLPGQIQDLEGDWYIRPESRPGEGLEGQWWNDDVKTAAWQKLHMPGSIFWFRYTTGSKDDPKGVIRDFDYSPDPATTGKPVYLYDFARAVNNDAHKTGLLYLNGQKVGEPATWSAWDVSKLLKPGANRLAMQTDIFGGRVFLSTEAPGIYPYLGAERNRLWVIFNNWLQDGRATTASLSLAGIRQADPNRPIKIMAPLGIGSDRWLDMAQRYGAWGHFTGEGVWGFFWYKRYGFLYGLPGTSEGGGPEADVAGQVLLFQRVMLEGLNGHDQVFAVQDITGKPPLKKWYEEHIAVLKQVGRYDIAGPQVIMYRSTNMASHLMPAPAPSMLAHSHEIQDVWNWDFGRGTFQSIGQSALYVDDGGIAQGKIDGYPIMVDEGNEIMTQEAIDHVEQWVRKGGTYIVLPFTGRSLVTAPDSWPIQQVTGCKVTALRTPGPGKGSVTIGKDQPLFKELAGKTFPDAGSSKDFQDFEHNQLSIELAPGPDCQVAATYENGSPAIVVHKLGAGRVITLGSVFFRNAKDILGLWWPGELESAFFSDLFANLGQPSVNSTADERVVAQRYRTNNGLDEVVVLDNFAGADRTVDLHVTLDRPPVKAYQVAMNTVREVPFTANGNFVTVPRVTIPVGEAQVFYFRDHNAGEAAAHWWQYQRKLWKPAATTPLDYSSIAQGRWVDPTVDLKGDWAWTQQAPADDAWKQPGFDNKAWPHWWSLDIFNAVGADPTKPLYARKTFTVPAGWLKDGGDGGITRLVAAGWSWSFTTSDTPWELCLNGQPLKKDGFFNPDVASLLHEGENVLTITLGVPKNGKYIGVLGSVYLAHSRPPAQTVNLAGTWTTTLDGQPVSLQFPGKGRGFTPSRTVDIPAEWKDKYIVTYYVKGARESAIGAIVNEVNVTRRHHHLFGDEVEVDITPFLHFGAPNTISMLPGSGDSLPAAKDWDLSAVELRLYPKAEYR